MFFLRAQHGRYFPTAKLIVVPAPEVVTTMSIAYRVKTFPRISAIQTAAEMKQRIEKMPARDLWASMNQKGIEGWKHKMIHDEIYRRSKKILALYNLDTYIV